ncbi:MAG: AEC family transporter [Candidatus Hydrogenedentota bacterium]|nr:MAG: AEC family transporter [Candidatus Hydrogenedentota bacterium]
MTIIEVVFPVFAIIALGYLLARNKQLDIPTISEIVVHTTSPCLVFISIAKREIVASEWLVMGGAAVAIVIGNGLIMGIYQRITRVRMRGLFLPAMFMNSGNMALPFSLLAFGAAGLDKAIIFFIAVATLNFSVGVFIAKGEGGFREIFRLPLIYAAVAGLIVSVYGIQLPKFIMTPVGMLAEAAIPLMILNLGIQLRSLTVSDVRHAMAGVGIRMGGGLLLATVFVLVFGVADLSRKVILLDSLMPPAVFTVVLAQKYNADPDAVASAIVIGTLLSVVVTPVFLMFVT